ncbi:MAG: energy transducer TonB, partial [Desulfomonilia bacterium]|nr:energy transducer TonB [Desulfomonilia bacterium]
MRSLIKAVSYLVLSVIIHVGVSQLFALTSSDPPEASPVKITLVSRQTPEQPAVIQEVEPVPTPEHQPEPRPEPMPTPIPKPQPSLEPPEEPVEEDLQVVEQPVQVEQAPPTAAAEVPPPVATIDKDALLDLYRHQVLTIIRAALRYPHNARSRGLEGTVDVRFTIEPNGTVNNVEILESSGSRLLDNASLKTIDHCTFP